MKTKLLAITFGLLLMTNMTLSAQERVIHSFEPFIGLNQVSSSLGGSGYFNNYTSTSKSSLLYGISYSLELQSGVNFQAGVNIFSYSISADSLNIPPVREDDIWSTFSFKYSSFDVPLKLGYTIQVGSKLFIRPSAGISLKFTSGHEFSETVFRPPPDFSFSEEVPPATLGNYENFGVAFVAGLDISTQISISIAPFVSFNYYSSTANLTVLQGWRSRVNSGKIQENGYWVAFGVRYIL